MKRRKIEEIGVSSRGRYMRNIADIPTKRKDIRIADIILIRSDICSNADIPKLYEIPNPAFKNKRYLSRFNLTYERKNCYGKQNKNL